MTIVRSFARSLIDISINSENKGLNPCDKPMKNNFWRSLMLDNFFVIGFNFSASFGEISKKKSDDSCHT
jgi:hypothetical protein